MIELQHISKTFRVAQRKSGFWQATTSLLKKDYKEVRALQDVSFSIPQGEIVGYIGPNGAGKSSTIKVMSGVLVPDEGECLINGIVPWKARKEHVRNIGVVFGQRSQLWWDLPVMDSFEWLRDVYDVDRQIFKQSLEELTAKLGLEEFLMTPVRQLSLGQRMRCEIAASLLHQPTILFLDEPTIGLDAISKLAVRDFIKSLNQTQQTTVILTTHDMQDIEALCQRIILIGKGQILLDGSFDQFMARQKHQTQLVIHFQSGQFQAQEGLRLVQQQGDMAIVEVDTSRVSQSDAIRMIAEQFELRSLTYKQPSAEELVVDLYREFDI